MLRDGFTWRCDQGITYLLALISQHPCCVFVDVVWWSDDVVDRRSRPLIVLNLLIWTETMMMRMMMMRVLRRLELVGLNSVVQWFARGRVRGADPAALAGRPPRRGAVVHASTLTRSSADKRRQRHEIVRCRDRLVNRGVFISVSRINPMNR